MDSGQITDARSAHRSGVTDAGKERARVPRLTVAFQLVNCPIPDSLCLVKTGFPLSHRERGFNRSACAIALVIEVRDSQG